MSEYDVRNIVQNDPSDVFGAAGGAWAAWSEDDDSCGAAGQSKTG